MGFKNIYSNFLKYVPEKKYTFNVTENSTAKTDDLISYSLFDESQKKVYPNLKSNLDFMKTKFNFLINSDIVFREFIINAKGKQFNAFLVYVDGMVRHELMDEFVIRPLMMRNQNNLFDGSQAQVNSNKINIRKVKKFNLADYITTSLIPQNALKKVDTFVQAINGINSGNCALFIDTLDVAFDIEMKGFSQRAISKPSNEVVIKGPHEAFVENLRTNTSMVRRIVNNENLVVENIEVGDITKTRCALMYIANITSDDLIAEVKYRLNNLSIDSLLSAGQLEQLITDDDNMSLPQLLTTERPDKASNYLLNGRVIIIVNGSPYSLIIPAVFSDFLSTPDEKNLRPAFANFIKIIRLISAFITLLLPGLYVAITGFHQELFPSELLFSIMASRTNVPFPVIIEIILLEISFELIREAGLRVPSPIGPTIGIVGALVLGQAAVSAGIISPILIIIVAITGIASFAIPDFSFGFQLRISRFVFILLGFLAGFLGIGLGIFVYLALLANTKSFGIPYTLGLTPFERIEGNKYFLPPIWKRESRASFLNSKKPQKQEHISMNWKYK